MPTKKPSAKPASKKSSTSTGLLGYLQRKAKSKIDDTRKANDRAKAQRIDEAVYGKRKGKK